MLLIKVSANSMYKQYLKIKVNEFWQYCKKKKKKKAAAGVKYDGFIRRAQILVGGNMSFML